jgi:MarR family transcriptional regulator, organic hydroperoxide resistance regulator
VSPEEELRFLILGAQREGNRMLADRLAPLGLTPSQAEVLRRLAEAGPLSLNALGRLLVCETGSPSRLVDTLVDRALGERTENPVDRRQVTLRLTPKGKRLALDASKVEDELHGWIRQRLGAGGLAAAAKQMRQLISGTTAGDAVARRKAGPKPG